MLVLSGKVSKGLDRLNLIWYNTQDRNKGGCDVKTLLKGARVYDRGALIPMDMEITDGVVTAREPSLVPTGDERIFELNGLVVFPGFVDVHVHLREPGFSYKETIATGSAACAHGGYTTVCAMPNLSPAPDSAEHVAVEQALIDADSVIRVLPYATITEGQKGEGRVIDMAGLASSVCGFSDDGRGVKDQATMREAMEKCKAAGSLIAAHCEDMSLIPKGAGVHAGRWAAEHGLPGIPSSSEWVPIKRDIALCKETGCDYHVCHVSTKESVALIRQAKAEGINITCETGPHYLLLCEDDMQDEGRFKMNPPLRAAEDRDALIAGLLDGTIDMIATDHAPHAAEEKSKGVTGSAMGVVGIESAFPLLYTYLVKTGVLTLAQLVEKMTDAPRKRFHLDGGIQVGDACELTVFDLEEEAVVDPAQFLSKGKATPFEGWKVQGVCKLTLWGDKVAYHALKGEC